MPSVELLSFASSQCGFNQKWSHIKTIHFLIVSNKSLIVEGKDYRVVGFAWYNQIIVDSVSAKLREDYGRWCTKIGDDHFASERCVGYRKVLQAHYLLTDYFLGEGENVFFGIKSEHLLLSALGRQHVEFEGKVKWKDNLEICATLFFGLIKEPRIQ